MLLLLLGLFLIMSILITSFSVEFWVMTEGPDIRSHIKFGIGRFLITIPPGFVARMNQTIRKRNFGTIEATWGGLKTAWRVADNLLQKVHLLHLEVSIGTGDPFSTALGTGGVWTLIGPMLTGLSASDRLQTRPEIIVQPDYAEAKVQVDLHCIFQFRLGQIIINELKRVMV